MDRLNFEDIVLLRLLLKTEGLGPAKILNLRKTLKSFNNVFKAHIKDLSSISLINSSLAERIKQQYLSLESEKVLLEKEMEYLEKRNGQFLSFWDEKYPRLLKNIYYPPLLLYVLGEISLLEENCLAIVGTRNASNYGKIITERISTEIVNKGLTVVSGLARGIDSIAHSSAISSGGKTIAVIGSGLDVIYPPENRGLFDRISKLGAVVSEYPLGTKPDAPNFPKRNRIIAGLSLGTLVIETKANGGAIQTAAHALNQNREVFAIPGNINVLQSEGTNLLIQRGEAKLVTCVDDILCELSIENEDLPQKNYDFSQLSLFEQQIIEKLSQEPKHIDVLASELSKSTSAISVELLQMEMSGFIKQLPGMTFIKNI